MTGVNPEPDDATPIGGASIDDLDRELSLDREPAGGTPGPSGGSRLARTIGEWVVVVVIAIAGWNVWSQLEAPQATSYRFDESKPYPFLDDVASNATLDATSLEALQFQDTKGEPWDLARYRGTKNVVLVITRGRTSGTSAARMCLTWPH